MMITMMITMVTIMITMMITVIAMMITMIIIIITMMINRESYLILSKSTNIRKESLK